MEAKKKDIEERKKAILAAKQMGAAENAAELEAKDAKKRAQQLAEIKRKETSLVSSIGAYFDDITLKNKQTNKTFVYQTCFPIGFDVHCACE